MSLHRLGVRSVLGGILLAVGIAGASDLEEAQKLYRRTQYSRAIEILKAAVATDSEACALIGQSYLMLGDPNRSIEYLHKAVALNSSKAAYYLWLGRAYGRKAEIAFPLAAPREAAKARVNFEKALELDPNNPDVTDDLFEFYLQAPGFLGGGFDKAARMAERIAQRDAAEGEFARAKLAEEKKDYSSAEALLRRAVELAPKQPRRFLDLAVFLAKRGRYSESDAAFLQARKFAPEAPRVLFQEASTYIHQNRKPEEARELLQQYLSSNAIGPEDPSKQEAQKLLRKVSGS